MMIWPGCLLLLLTLLWSGNGQGQASEHHPHRYGQALVFRQKYIKSHRTKQSAPERRHDRLRKQAPFKVVDQDVDQNKRTKAQDTSTIFALPHQNIFDKRLVVHAPPPTTTTAHPSFDRRQFVSYSSSSSSSSTRPLSSSSTGLFLNGGGPGGGVPAADSAKSVKSSSSQSELIGFSARSFRYYYTNNIFTNTKSVKSIKTFAKNRKSSVKSLKFRRTKTVAPTIVPTARRTSIMPTRSRVTPTTSPIATTARPETLLPTTDAPTAVPSTTNPTVSPTFAPSLSPTTTPTQSPTLSPTLSPVPTMVPTQQPTTTQMPTEQRGVLFFRLYNTKTDELAFPNSTITGSLGDPMQENDEYSLTEIGTAFVSIQAVTNPADLASLDARVRLQLYSSSSSNDSDPQLLHQQTEFLAPYFLFGDNNGDIFSRLEFVVGVNYTIVAQAFDNNNDNALGVEQTVFNFWFVA